MSRHVLPFVLLFGVVATGYATEEGAWSYRLGVSYRDIGEVDVDNVQFSNTAFGGGFVNGRDNSDGTSSGFVLDNSDGAQNTVNGFPPLGVSDRQISLDALRGGGTSHDLGEETGFIFTAEKGLSSVGNSRVALDLSVQYHNADLSTTTDAQVTSRSYIDAENASTRVNTPPIVAPNAAPHPDALAVAGATGNATTEGRLAFDMDMDVFTFGVGIKGVYDADRFRLTVGAGPTLSVVNIESEVQETVTWNTPLDPTNPYIGEDVYTKPADDDQGLDMVFGGYLSLGAEIRLNEAIGVGVEWRYDHAFEDASSDYADVDITGQSGQIFLILNY